MVTSHTVPTEWWRRERCPERPPPEDHFPPANQHWSGATFVFQPMKLTVRLFICKRSASQVPISRIWALASAETEGVGVSWGGSRWLITSLSRNCVPTLHEYMKGPGTHSKMNVFFCYSPARLTLPSPLAQAVVSKEAKPPVLQKWVPWSLPQYQALSACLPQGLDAWKRLHQF